LGALRSNLEQEADASAHRSSESHLGREDESTTQVAAEGVEPEARSTSEPLGQEIEAVADTNRTWLRSSSEEGDDGDPAVLGFSSKRSYVEEATSSAAAAASTPKKRHLQKVTEDFHRMEAEGHAPVRKPRVSVRTRCDSTTVSCSATLLYFTQKSKSWANSCLSSVETQCRWKSNINNTALVQTMSSQCYFH